MKLIVPIGKAGSGKSTAAAILRYLAQERGLLFQEMAFAGPLKAFCKAVFGFDDHALYGPSEARNALDPRYTGSDSEHAWKLAEYHLRQGGDYFIEQVLPNADNELSDRATVALIKWFDDLRADYKKLSPRLALQTLGTEWGRALDPNIWINCLRKQASLTPADLVGTDGRFLNEAQDTGGFAVLILRDGGVTGLGENAGHASERDQQSDEMLTYCQAHGAVVHNNGSLDDLQKQLAPILDRILSG